MRVKIGPSNSVSDLTEEEEIEDRNIKKLVVKERYV